MPTDLTEQEIRSFVGSKADYYLGKWAAALSGESQDCGFNGAAFLLSGFWFPYRKMYIITVIFYGIIFVESVAEDVLFVDILGKPESPMALQRIIGIDLAIVTGLLGNRLYLYHTRTKIAELRNQELPEDDHLKALSKQGGTSLGAAFGMFFLFLLAICSVTFMLEFLREMRAAL